MKRVRLVLWMLGAVLALPSLAASPAGLTFTGYGATANDTSGYDYIRFPPPTALAPLATNLLAGTFIAGDYSTEYAVDDQGSLVTVDTASGAVTLIGALGFSVGLPASIAANPATHLLLGFIENQDVGVLDAYTIDIVTGQATVIAPLNENIQSIAFDPANVLYALDRDAGAIGVGDLSGFVMLGPLGVALNDSSTIAIDPESGMLLLIQFEPDAGTNAIYVVDTTTGRATLVGALGGAAPITAIALAPPLPDTIFSDGFD